MKRSTLWIVVIYAVLALVLGACRREATSSETATSQTIEPARPQPGDNDSTALTQTVDVEAGRSEVEGRTASGADITAMSSDTVTTSTATTTTTIGTTTAPPAPTTTTR